MAENFQVQELSKENQLIAMADICEQLKNCRTIRLACQTGLSLIQKHFNYERVSIYLSSIPVDSDTPFYGFYRVDQPMKSRASLFETNGCIADIAPLTVSVSENVKEWSLQGIYQNQVNRLCIPFQTDGEDEPNYFVADKLLDQDSWSIFEQHIFQIFATSLSSLFSIRKMEYGLKQKNQQLRALIDNLPAYIYVKDVSSRFLVANRKLAYENNVDDPDDMLGKTDFDYFPKELAQKFFDDEQQLIKSGKPLLNIEEDGHNRDGSHCWVMTTKIPVKDKSGKVTSLVGIGLDITDKKQYRQQMEENEQCYRTLFGNIRDAIVVHDSNGHILDSNEEAHKLFQHSHETLQTLSVSDLQVPDYDEFYKKGEADSGYQTPFKQGDEVQFCLDIKVSSIDYRGTKAYLALFRDVTDLDDARQFAENAAKAKSAFLANMSHEIRTPLNAVIGMTTLLSDSTMTDEQREFVQTIETSGEVLLTLINDILDLSKIEAGAFHLEEIPFNIRHCVNGAVDIVAQKATEKGLEMACCVNGEVPHVFIGDSPRLRQVLLNLLNNAIKFTHDGEVVVRVKGKPMDSGLHQLDFSVKDTGIGMNEETVSRVFRPFEQADTSTTRKYGGTGLGLSICNRLVEMMGGSLHVKSAVGEGSEFSFDIILKQAEDDAETAQERVNLKMVRNRRVLVVDDNETNLQIIEYQLKQWSMLPLIFTNPADVLRNVDNLGNIDAVILDMLMPEMDGEMLAAKLRESPGFKTCPILILSSSANAIIPETTAANAWLSKPARPDKMLEKLAMLFESTDVQRLAASTKVEPVETHTLGVTHPLKILVAEDNIVNQKVATKLLERLGYETDIASNGLEVLNAVKEKEYDLVLMDIQMPLMDGIEATEELLTLYPDGNGPKVVAMTAHALQENREQALNCGMSNYIVKPIRFDDLIAVLKDVPKRNA